MKRNWKALALTLFLLPIGINPAAYAEIPAKEVMTLWWVVFNNPDACGEACGEEDFENPDVAASVVYGTGQMTARDGRTRLVASLYGAEEGFADELIGGPGLTNVDGAEVHLVVRSHGDVIADARFDQMTQFVDANCSDLGGPNECRDIQFAIHPPGGDSSESVFWFPDLNGGAAVERASSRLWRQAGGLRVVVETDVR